MKSKKSAALSATAASLVLICLIAIPAVGEDKKIVRISGASLIAGVVEDFQQEFSRANPNCHLSVSGATTGIGFQKMIDGDAELAMMTRKVTSEEAKLAETKGVTLASKRIGAVCLAVVTNSKNPVNELTMDQLAKIFKGETTNWSEVGGPNEPIKVTVRPAPETGSGVLFQEIVLKGAPYAKNAQVMSSFRTTLQVCAKSIAIGYIPTTTVHFDKLSEMGTKIIKIKKDANSQPYLLINGVAKETLYPIAVDFILYWNAKREDTCIKTFAEYCEKQTQ